MRSSRTGADRALAIDVGTQSVRAMLVDPRGSMVAVARVPIEPYRSPRPGWVGYGTCTAQRNAMTLLVILMGSRFPS